VRHMIVCSCNVLTDHDVRTAVSGAAAQTTGAVYGCSAAVRNAGVARAQSGGSWTRRSARLSCRWRLPQLRRELNSLLRLRPHRACCRPLVTNR